MCQKLVQPGDLHPMACSHVLHKEVSVLPCCVHVVLFLVMVSSRSWWAAGLERAPLLQ